MPKCRDIPIIHIAYKKNQGFMGINKFWSGDIGTVCHEESHKKNQQYSKRF